jgi:O-antigen/teichoic acid export membrane protein
MEPGAGPVSPGADDAPASGRSPLRPLVTSRVVDQAALGLASLVLARALGPDGFAPVAALFVVYSLGLQISDFGVGFAVYRSAPGHRVARRSLSRVRAVDLGIAVVLLVAGAIVGGDVGVVLAVAGPVWLLSAEVYVRKAGVLKQGNASRVAVAELVGAAVFLAGSVVLVAVDAPVAVVGLLFVAKLLVELVIVRGWHEAFAADGEPAQSGAEWLGQVMTYLVANVDYLLVALLLGPEDLSIYVIAFRFASAVPAFLAGPITQTSFIEYAAADADGHQRIYARLLSRIVRLGGAGVVVLIVAAPLLPLVLGSAWDDVAPVLVVLAVAVPWRLLLGTTVALAITSGRARAVVMWETGRLVVMAAAVAVASIGGLTWVAVAVSTGTIVSIGLEHLGAAAVARLRVPGWFVPVTGAAAVAATAFGAVMVG